MPLPKSELVSKLTDLSNNKLTSDARWQLRDKLTDWNFNAFSAFMLDVHAQLAILSKSFQSNSLTVFDIPKNLNRSLRALQKLKDTPGPAEQAFWAEMRCRRMAMLMSCGPASSSPVKRDASTLRTTGRQCKEFLE